MDERGQAKHDGIVNNFDNDVEMEESKLIEKSMSEFVEKCSIEEQVREATKDAERYLDVRELLKSAISDGIKAVITARTDKQKVLKLGLVDKEYTDKIIEATS